MERLLEAVLGSFLQDYVHSSKETEGGAFKASWSARGISLHDINININKIKFPRANLRKATAKSLEVKIPWASLATKAIEVWFQFCMHVLSHSYPMRRSKLLCWLEFSGTHSGR